MGEPPPKTLKSRVGDVLIPLMPVNRRVFGLFRFELNAFISRQVVRFSPGCILKRRALRKEQGLKLNVGSGGRGIPGWVNVDVGRSHADQSLPCDIRHGLPLRDSQVALIFAEHIIEHIEVRQDLPFVLKEFLRVLEPGGRVRIIVPDAERYLRAYASGRPEDWAALGLNELPADMPTYMSMVNHVFHQDGEHFFAYDFATMKYQLERAGFVDVARFAYQQSADPTLAIDQANHAPYSLYVEARKPARI
jgi:predicted SAM-dependent methyltransferase